MGDAPDHTRLAAEVLGIRGAAEPLARRLVSQALVLGDRKEAWRRVGERICAAAPAVPGVYVVRDEEGKAYTVRYEAVNAMLLNEFLKEHRKMQDLEATLERQQNEIDSLKSTLPKRAKSLERQAWK